MTTPAKLYDVRAYYRGRTYSLMAIPYEDREEAVRRKEDWEATLPYVEFRVEALDPNGPYENLPSNLIERVRSARRAEYEAQKMAAEGQELRRDPRFEQRR